MNELKKATIRPISNKSNTVYSTLIDCIGFTIDQLEDSFSAMEIAYGKTYYVSMFCLDNTGTVILNCNKMKKNFSRFCYLQTICIRNETEKKLMIKSLYNKIRFIIDLNQISISESSDKEQKRFFCIAYTFGLIYIK